MAISDPLTSAAPTHAQLRASLDARTPEMLAHIQQFVDLESPSAEVDDLQRSAEFLAAVMTHVLGT
ncbi:MAG: hypothetical protein O2940_08245, partial [Actinomycetota bacterium]|nr:hypothetical protein [Actinomycetota bacterium]